MAIVQLTIQRIVDPTTGRPVSNGRIYTGDANQSPIDFPREMRALQQDGSEIVVAQPIRTNSAGYPVLNGSPVQLRANAPYSLLVRNQGNGQVFYIPSIVSESLSLKSYQELSDAVGDVSLVLNDVVFTVGKDSPFDGLGAQYSVVPSGTGTPDNDTFINLNNGLQLRLVSRSANFSTNTRAGLIKTATNATAIEATATDEAITPPVLRNIMSTIPTRELGLYNDLFVSTISNETVGVVSSSMFLGGEAVNGINLAIDISNSGANGLDTGSESADTWYYVWVIYNGTAAAGLFSLSNDNPTLPTGYSAMALVGAVRNDSSSDFISFRQTGKRAWLDSQIVDENNTSTGTSANLATITAPPNIKAIVNARMFSSSVTTYGVVTEVAQADMTPSVNAYDLITGSATANMVIETIRRTDGASQIRYRTTVSTADFTIQAKGWEFD